MLQCKLAKTLSLQEILKDNKKERFTGEIAPGEWRLFGYIARGMENVPIFIKTDNTENEIEKHLNQTTKRAT